MSRKYSFFLLLAITLVFMPESVVGQDVPEWTGFEQQRQQINKTGMLVLGTWAVGNILTGAYGNGLILQGAFLFVFDIVLYFIHRNHASLELFPLIDKLGASAGGIGVVIQL